MLCEISHLNVLREVEHQLVQRLLNDVDRWPHCTHVDIWSLLHVTQHYEALKLLITRKSLHLQHQVSWHTYTCWDLPTELTQRDWQAHHHHHRGHQENNVLVATPVSGCLKDYSLFPEHHITKWSSNAAIYTLSSFNTHIYRLCTGKQK